MLQVLTEEESEESNKKLEQESNRWWANLSLRERKLIYRHYKDILKQMLCEHKWHETKLYSKPMLSCSECGLDLEDSSNKRSVITEKKT